MARLMPALEFRSFHSHRSCEIVPNTTRLATLPLPHETQDTTARYSLNTNRSAQDSTMRERAPNGGGLEPHETHCHAQRFKRSRRTHARWTNTQAAGRRSGPAPPRKLLTPHPFGSGAQAAASRRPRLLPPPPPTETGHPKGGEGVVRLCRSLSVDTPVDAS
jgi:hypothetical protein